MSVMTITVTLACLTGGVMTLWVIGSLRFKGGVERPKYSILHRKIGYEIREYESYIIAKASVFGSFSRS